MEIKCNNIREFVDIVKDKRIVCWGIGNYFNAFLDSVEVWQRELHFGYLIDNALDLHGSRKDIFGSLVSILSFEQYLKVHKVNDVIIISTVHYSEIMEQIEQSGKNIPVIVYTKIRHGNSEVVVNRRENSMVIPPVMHYCWFGGKSIPEQDQAYIDGWRRMCPDYEVICWNEQNFDVNQIAYTKFAYENGKWAFVSDYVRIYVLYHYGGIYLDTDVELLKNLDELRYQYAYMGMEMLRIE